MAVKAQGFPVLARTDRGLIMPALDVHHLNFAPKAVSQTFTGRSR